MAKRKEGFLRGLLREKASLKVRWTFRTWRGSLYRGEVGDERLGVKVMTMKNEVSDHTK